MSALTDTFENRVLNFLTGNAGATAPTLPLKLRIMTANGSDSAAGTEATGGSYASQTVTMAAASDGSSTSSADVTFADMPSGTFTGGEIWDSNGTPVRLAHAAFASPIGLNSGDDLVFPAGTITMTAA